MNLTQLVGILHYLCMGQSLSVGFLATKLLNKKKVLLMSKI